MIEAAQELQLAVRQTARPGRPSGRAARRAATERIGHEALGRQVRAAQVAAARRRRRRRTARRGTPIGTGMPATVQHAGDQAGDRRGRSRCVDARLPSGRPPAGQRSRYGDVDRGLGDAVHVDQPRPLRRHGARTRARGAGSSASPPKITSRRSVARARLRGSTCDELGEGRGVWLSTRHPLGGAAGPGTPRGERLTLVGHDHQPAAVQQGPQSSQTEKSKAKEWNRVQTSCCAEPEPGLGRGEQAQRRCRG